MAALKARKLEQAAEKKRIRFIQMLETRYQVTGEGYSLVNLSEPDEVDEELLAEQALYDTESDDDSGASMTDSEAQTTEEEDDTNQDDAMGEAESPDEDDGSVEEGEEAGKEFAKEHSA